MLSLHAPGLRAAALGDAELDGQARLARRLRQARVAPYDVVVMAHHGSARQDEGLADLLAPRLTVVSVGQDNDYGHPSAAAIDLYAGSGPVLRTDLCGPVAVVRTSSPAGLEALARCPGEGG
ncbi:hypothetical protein [Georgenia sp. SUBG003]|uniref:hypothetical protein n=1 Tax=Georgenia sp. SUBG003 TaxID=1497974 RepID=UPI003AB57D3A